MLHRFTSQIFTELNIKIAVQVRLVFVFLMMRQSSCFNKELKVQLLCLFKPVFSSIKYYQTHRNHLIGVDCIAQHLRHTRHSGAVSSSCCHSFHDLIQLLFRLFLIPWTVALQTCLSFTVYQSLLVLMSIESMMPSNHIILCRPFLRLSQHQGLFR